MTCQTTYDTTKDSQINLTIDSKANLAIQGPVNRQDGRVYNYKTGR